jgi:gamma-glutamyltranspeptidase / glutathione hydrolase
MNILRRSFTLTSIASAALLAACVTAPTNFTYQPFQQP